MTLTNVSFAVKAGGAAIAALWLGLAPVSQILLVLMALDIATGLFAAYVRQGLDSMVSGRGIAKKAIELLIVAAAQWVSPMPDGRLAGSL
jgi:phage-related holin